MRIKIVAITSGCISLVLAGCVTVPQKPLLTRTPHENSVELTYSLQEAERTAKNLNQPEARKSYALAVTKAAQLVAEGVRPDSHYKLEIRRTGPAVFDPAKIDRLEPCDPAAAKHFKQYYNRNGIGAPLVVFTPVPPKLKEFAPRRGFCSPATAVVDFKGARSAVFTLYRPTWVDTVKVCSHPYPLAAEWSAALAADLERVNPLIAALRGFFQIVPDASKCQLVFLENYDPAKVPVIFVHGLLSTPWAWANLINELNASPELRRNYQFWAFGYPTGSPIVYSGYLFRNSLAAAEKATGAKRIVLIGHSMGGIISRLQAVRTGRELWDTSINGDADRLYTKLDPNDLLKQMLIFDPDPHIGRIIFIATPHRGSNLTEMGIAKFAMRFVRAPFELIQELPKILPILLTSDQTNDRENWKRIPTSLHGLAEHSPLTVALEKMPIQCRYNSIIGIRNAANVEGSSDGVVQYWSSHLDGAESELTVPADHGAFHHPQAVAEIQRILNADATHN